MLAVLPKTMSAPRHLQKSCILLPKAAPRPSDPLFLNWLAASGGLVPLWGHSALMRGEAAAPAAVGREDGLWWWQMRTDAAPCASLLLATKGDWKEGMERK